MKEKLESLVEKMIEFQTKTDPIFTEMLSKCKSVKDREWFKETKALATVITLINR